MTTTTCATCVHFDTSEEAKKRLRDSDAWKGIVKYGTLNRKARRAQKAGRALPGKPDELGLCGIRTGTCVGPRSKACAGHEERKESAA